MNFVFEIAGFFIFVVGMGYLAFSGRIADMFRDRAPKPLLLIALITVFAVHHWIAILSEPLPAADSSSPEMHSTASSGEVPAAPSTNAPVAARHSSKPAKPQQSPAPQEAQPEPGPGHWETTIVKEVDPIQPPASQAVDRAPAPPMPKAEPAPTTAGSDPYESKAKRGIKAMGRFLHLRKTSQ